MQTYTTIRYEISKGVAHITLTVPAKHNAMSSRMLAELEEAFWEADNDNAVHCVLLKGEGPSFCSGYDLSGTATGGSDPQGREYRRNREIDDDSWQLEKSNTRLLAIFDMHKPVLAQVHGNCLAGGTGLALLCDMVICSHDAVFGFPAARGMGTLPEPCRRCILPRLLECQKL